MCDGQGIGTEFAQAFFAGSGVDALAGELEHPDVLDTFGEAGVDLSAEAEETFVA